MTLSQDSLPKDMLAVILNGEGGPEVLTPARLALPPVRAGEVLIRVAAAGVNGPDISQREGRYAPPPDASPLPGLEVSGTIAALGAGVTRFAPGQSVVALCNGGGYAEYVAVPAGQVLPSPAGWSWADAAGLPETFFTIQQTLVERSRLEPGMNVLVHGGSGGLGATAIQMGKLHGCTILATASGPEKMAYAAAMGADAVIDYRKEDFVARCRELTDGRGVDRILDIIGGDYLGRNLRAAARNAVILQLAMREGARTEIDLGPILMKALTLTGSTLRPQSGADKARLAAGLAATVWPAIAAGRIRPARTRTFPLDRAADAHRSMESRDHYGKIVLVTDFGAAAG